DEEIDFLAEDQVGARLGNAQRRTVDLLARARAGRLLNDGLRIAIVGKPNAGKSSLFNALARREAAIVTAIPGTTRDIVRETVQLGGIPVALADTAGLRETEDPIEREGVRRTRAELAEADLVLWVTDVTDPDPGPPPETVVPVLRIANKIDRADAPAVPDGAIALSALTGEGLEALDRAVAGRFDRRETDSEFTARQRHIEAIERTAEHLDRARAELERSRSGELVAEELKLAADALGEITGRIHSDDLLGRIFSSFCIGK
ncbi:MAG: tRNA modification GTPase, partial [Wenzhouxiangellaceae bacterium]